nr:hypothetical protein [Solidesulfovibrio alcoholivorans]
MRCRSFGRRGRLRWRVCALLRIFCGVARLLHGCSRCIRVVGEAAQCKKRAGDAADHHVCFLAVIKLLERIGHLLLRQVGRIGMQSEQLGVGFMDAVQQDFTRIDKFMEIHIPFRRHSGITQEMQFLQDVYERPVDGVAEADAGHESDIEPVRYFCLQYCLKIKWNA